MKRILSIVLALCMVATLLPVSALAEEIHTTVGTSGEIIRFAPLAETEKTKALGTSIQDLELPERLTATVRTAVPIRENSVQDSGSPETATPTVATEPEWEETTVDIPVKWEPAPEYDPETKDEYIFTPEIEGYTVRAELPEITVTVGELLPTAAAFGLPAPLSATNYDIYVGGVQVTDSNMGNITGSGIAGTVTYDPGTNTLTLDNANITYGYNTTIDDRNVQFGIYSTLNALRLVVVGTNTITCPNASVKDSYGIYTTGTLEMSESGSGSLTATGGTAIDISAGMYVAHGLTIKSSSLTANGGKATSLQSKSYGVYADSLTIEGGSLTANGGEVTEQSGKSYGVYVAHSLNMESGSLTANGGTATAQYYGESYGVYAHSLTLGGTLTAKGGTAIKSSGKSTGVYVADRLTINSGSLTAIGSAATAYSYGVCVGSSVSVAGDGSLTATGGKTSGTSAGVYVNNISSNGSTGSVSVSSSGKLVATGGAASETFGASYGVYLDNRSSTGSTVSVSVSDDGSLTATGVAASGSQGRSAGVYFDNTSGNGSTVSVSVSGSGKLIATGGMASTTSGGTSAGVYLYNASSNASVSVSDEGRLTATGDAASASYGVSAENGSLSISDGTITAQSGAASRTSAGVYSGSLSVGGGMVTATGCTASGTSGTSAGVYATSVSVFGSGKLTATGDAASETNGTSAGVFSNGSGSSVSVFDDGSLTATGDAASGFVGKSAGVYFQSSNGSMTVSNGTVKATGGTASDTSGTSAGVHFQYSGSMTVSGGTVEATGGTASATSGGVYFQFPDGSMSVSGGTVTAQSNAAATSQAMNILPPDLDHHTSDSSVMVGDVAPGTEWDKSTALTNYKYVQLVVEPAPTYTITFNSNGGTVSEASRSVASGTAVGTLPTPTRSGSYSFDGWYTAASGGIQISESTTVSANVTYYAHWTYTGGGDGNGGGSSSNDNNSSVIVTPPAPDKPNSPTQGEIKVPGTADNRGNITVNITDKAVTDAFDKALADAKKNGNEQNGITVALRVDTGSKTGSNVTVNLPKTVQDAIIAKKIVSTVVVVDNPGIRIGMDLTTVQEINKQAKSDVNITATRTDSGKLTGDAKSAIGSRPVFDLKVNYGSGKSVQSFGAGSVSVTIPYTLGANEKAENVKAVYVDGDGKVHWLANSVYDSVEKVLRFSTNHFSTYGIGYKQQSTAFTDIAAHWAEEDIAFVVSRGLFSGTSATTFSPNTAMTRGMFVTALGRLADADVSGYTKSSFTDVKSDAYYMGYIEWASKNSIANGIGKNKFAPDQSITREQMAVIMLNYAKVIGFTLPKVHAENTFADNAKISAYAKDAVKQMQMAGVVSGKNGNLFDPQGTATRAEVTAVLRRFVELAISSDIMQGWTKNDSGRWMY